MLKRLVFSCKFEVAVKFSSGSIEVFEIKLEEGSHEVSRRLVSSGSLLVCRFFVASWHRLQSMLRKLSFLVSGRIFWWLPKCLCQRVFKSV